MNELDMIREVLDSPPPSPSTTLRARHRLIAAMEAPAGSRRRPIPSPSPRPRWVMRWALALGGGAALAGLAAAALLVPMTTGTGQSGRPPAALTETPAELSAHDILLAAAARAERAPTDTGRYWHVRSVGLYGPVRVGPSTNQYDLVSRQLSETWIARQPTEQSWLGFRELGHQPRTEADQQAWRNAGSPDHWDIAVDTATGTRRLTRQPGEPRLDAHQPTPFLEDLGGFDLAALQALPTDPATLKALFVERITAHLGCPSADASAGCLFSALSRLLLDVPAPPEVRAAAFAVLAEIPNVRSLGQVKDGQGRTGLGIQLDSGSEIVATSHKIIIDPSTYRVLGHEYVARAVGQPAGRPVKDGNTVMLVAEWTDKAPEPPAVP